MNKTEAKIGIFVKTNVEFSGVPTGTLGIIDEEYLGGVTVAWDLPDQPLSKEYIVHVVNTKSLPSRMHFSKGWPLRDGFGWDELKFLDLPC